MNELFFEGNRTGSLPPCGPLIPAGPDDHMIRNAEFYRTWLADKLLPGTLAFVLAMREEAARGYDTRLAAGLTTTSEPRPKWSWKPE
jgi:hypothetical protein